MKNGSKAWGQKQPHKHGTFAGNFMILPNENGDEFELLHHRLIDEWKPVGALEEDTVLTLANCIWLKRRVERIYNREATWGQSHQNSDEIKHVVSLAHLIDRAKTFEDAMNFADQLPELYKKPIKDVPRSNFKDDKSWMQCLKSKILDLAEVQENFTIATQSFAFKAEKMGHLRELTAKKSH
jgi:hypothetical protein